MVAGDSSTNLTVLMVYGERTGDPMELVVIVRGVVAAVALIA